MNRRTLSYTEAEIRRHVDGCTCDADYVEIIDYQVGTVRYLANHAARCGRP